MGQSYPLKTGENTFGRKEQDPFAPPKASVQIQTFGNKKMSRCHAKINVAVRQGVPYAIISNAKNMNDTIINNSVLLRNEEEVILNDGDQILCGGPGAPVVIYKVVK